jgi:hypothetical protein
VPRNRIEIVSPFAAVTIVVSGMTLVIVVASRVIDWQVVFTPLTATQSVAVPPSAADATGIEAATWNFPARGAVMIAVPATCVKPSTAPFVDHVTF